MNLKETYNRIAEDWYKDHTDDTWWVEGTDTFVSFLQPGSTVLDVGCGAGTKSRYLRDKGLEVTGLDFSENMIEIARREAPEIAFYVADMHDLRSIPGLYGAVFAQASLLHIPKNEVPAVIGQFKDKLQPGGYLYIAVKEKRADGSEEELKVENDYGYAYERFFSYFTMPELRSYLGDAGFSVLYESAAQTGKTTWLQVVAKKN